MSFGARKKQVKKKTQVPSQGSLRKSELAVKEKCEKILREKGTKGGKGKGARPSNKTNLRERAGSRGGGRTPSKLIKKKKRLEDASLSHPNQVGHQKG